MKTIGIILVIFALLSGLIATVLYFLNQNKVVQSKPNNDYVTKSDLQDLLNEYLDSTS